jgi:hypothetical protein
MNIVAMVHRGAAEIVRTMGPVWRKAAADGQVVAVANVDCEGPWEWADRVVVWPRDPGHNGPEQCRRHCHCLEIAAGLDGVTAVVEPDAFVTGPVEVQEGEMWGSRLWDAKDELRDRKYVARWFLHPPYVARQETFRRVAEVMGWWIQCNRIIDDGHNDRVLGLAAQVAGVRLVGAGFSRNTVQGWEAAELRKAMENGVSLVHGVKDRRLIEWWLVKEGLMEAREPTLWDEMGIEPDTRKIPWAMDLRHVEVLRRLVVALQPRTVMEIGSHRGHSTAGILRGMEAAPETRLHVVEPAPTPELRSLLERTLVRERVELHECSSWETRIRADMVVIDGNHEWPALADLAQALAWRASAIVMHDTRSAKHGIGGCWGAQLAADILRKAEGRGWVCDEKQRAGEWTHRGLGVSVVEPARMLAAQQILREVCG